MGSGLGGEGDNGGDLPARDHAADVGTLTSHADALTAPTRAEAKPATKSDQLEELGRGTLVDRYVIYNRIGEGGMGVVFAAYDPELDRRVAIKFLHADVAHNERRRNRLLREAQAMARLSHPNVATVHDVGNYHGQIFIAMELVGGTNLTRWLETERDWREVRELFLAAGRGLAAAHDAGVIHRDFKPDNVLVDEEGQPKVTDFGLARGLGGSESDEVVVPSIEALSPSLAVLDTPLTQTGAFLGTPSYMAPEQHRGERATERSDQFAFAVALYEALYHQRPFSGNDFAALSLAVTTGKLTPPPTTSTVPRWLHRVVMRGLATAAADRFPSMAAMLDELGADPTARRRRVALALVALAAVAGGVYFAANLRAAPAECGDGRDRLEGIWDRERKAAVESAFLATERVYARDTWELVAEEIDRYTRRWSETYRDTCAATHIRHEQSQALLDLRMRCLDDRRLALGALTRLFAEKSDPEILVKAVDAVYTLPEISACNDSDNLQRLAPLPDDPAAREEIAEIEESLRRADALSAAGKYADALVISEKLLAPARRIGHRRTLAAVLRHIGAFRSATSSGDSIELFYAAAIEAAAAGDSELEAEVWLALLSRIGKEEVRIAEGAVLQQITRAAIARAGDDSLLIARMHNVIGGIRFEESKFEAAVEEYQQALEIWIARSGRDSPNVATALSNLGAILINMGRFDEAAGHLEEALAIRERVLGPDHPDIAYSLSALAELWGYQGHHQRARDAYLRVEKIRRQALGDDHLLLGLTLDGLAWTLAELGDHAGAVAAMKEALAIYQKKLKPDDLHMAGVHNSAGSILAMAKQYDAAAVHFEQALSIWLAGKGPDHPDVATARINLGALANLRGDYRRAVEECRAGEVILDEYGKDNLHLTELYGCIGKGLLGQGQVRQAIPILEKALATARRQGLGADVIADVEFALARALGKDGKRPRAISLAEQARARLTEGALKPELVAEISSWLDEHRR